MRYYRERMEGWLGDTLEGLEARRHLWYASMEADLHEITDRVARHGFYAPCIYLSRTRSSPAT